MADLPLPADPDPAMLGLTTTPEALLVERCAFLKLSPEDSALVQRLRPALTSCAAEFIDAFYQHLDKFPATAAFLTDPRLVERLKQLQLGYFRSLVDAALEPSRVADRRRIGERHAEVGLEPHWFLGTFSLYLEHGFRVLAAQPGEEHADLLPAMHALVKHILLDIGLTLDAYYERSTTNLREALRLYAQSNTKLREFARLASHDLKTPLATISGLCEEFLDEFGGQVPESASELIRQARHRTLRMRDMIDELLAISEAAAQPDQRQLLGLRGVIDEVLERVRHDYPDHGVDINVPTHMPEVTTHSARLREALYQLVANAVKYMDQPGGQVWITAEARPDRIHLQVIDNGPGIPADDLDRIFSPFRRLPRNRQVPGHGLGLYLVRQMVEELGGRVWCESDPPRGAVFHVVLPQRPAS